MTKTATDSRAVARLRLVVLSDARIELAIPGTGYRLFLKPTVPAAQITTPPGKRIAGIIEARALRMHNARAGGIFIEPVIGVPRIVQGRVMAVDRESNRLLVNLVAPFWVSMHEGQQVEDLMLEKLVNFYLESDSTFTPA